MGQVDQSIHSKTCHLYGSYSKFSPCACGMEVLANFLSNPLASGGDGDAVGWPYVAFDLDPTLVKVSVSEHCARLLSTSICIGLLF